MTARHRIIRIAAGLALAGFVSPAAGAFAEKVTHRPGVPTSVQGKPPTPPLPVPPPNYIIGADDILSIFVRHEQDLTGDFVVRPDGKITMPLLNDIQAAGLTPDQLREVVTAAAVKFVPDATVTIIVKQINSRKVFITGAVNKPGFYPLAGPMTVLQLITMAGGLQDFADTKKIILISATLKDAKGQPMSYLINYDDLRKGKNLAKNNIELRPGDQIIVPE